MQEGNSSRSLAARAVLVVLAGTLLVGLGLAAWVSFDAIPDSAWQTSSTPSIHDTASPSATRIDNLYQIVFYMAVAVFVLVEGLIIWAALAFRRKEGDPEPVQVHGNNRAEVAWTVAPTVIVLILAYLSYGAMQERFVTDYGDEALTINAIGRQWWWEFEYPEQGFETATEMVVPVGEPVRVLLESYDVIHSFWVPELGGKYDAVPGVRDGGSGQNAVSFVVDRPGRYYGHCAEMCGTQHSGMRFSVIAVSREEFDAWSAAHAAIPEPPTDDTASEDVVRGFDALTSRCLICHQVDGVNHRLAEGEESEYPVRSEDTPGPNLTRMAARTQLAGAVFDHTAENASAWIEEPDSMKYGTKMQAMGLTADQIDDVLAYLYSMKIEDDVMAPIYQAEPVPAVIPPAYDEVAMSGEHEDRAVANTQDGE